MTGSDIRAERPVVAVTQCRDPDYRSWIDGCGGIARIVAPGEPDPLRGVSGLLLTGGEDVNPARYGETPRHRLRVSAERDDFEFPLLEQALGGSLPVLAVCRGMQLLVVSQGGALYQDLGCEYAQSPDKPTRVEHRGPEGADVSHSIEIEAGTRLASVLSSPVIVVNSHHHQGVRLSGPCLRVAARSADGLPEAVEGPRERFILGVQWHPERWRHGSSASIIRSFLLECMTVTR